MSRLHAAGVTRPHERHIFRPLPRERLTSLLSTASQSRVTLLIAGAGFGKSVALEHWIAATKPADLIRHNVRSEAASGIFAFADGFARALAPVSKTITKSIPGALAAARNAPLPQRDLATWLGGHLRRFNGTIVLDDLHIATAADPRVGPLLSALIEDSADDLRWIIASRSATDLPVASWIAYGTAQMPIEESDLRFTLDEAREVCSTLGVPLTEGEIDAVQYLTQGWAAGFTFAALSGSRNNGITGLLAATREMSYDFMAQQVLSNLDEVEQELLLRTSVFEEIDTAILAARFPTIASDIERLRRKATFIARTANSHFKYHDLFRDFLQIRLRESAWWHAAWQDAGELLERSGRAAEALAAFATINASTDVARVLRAQGNNLIDHGKREVVFTALSALRTHPAFEEDPKLLALRALLASGAGEFERADALFEKALSGVELRTDRVEIGIAYAVELGQRDPQKSENVLLPLLDLQPSNDQRSRILSMIATRAWQAGRKDEGRRAIDEAMSLAATFEDQELQALLAHQHALLQFFAGEFEAAARTDKRALEIVHAHQLSGLAAKIHSLLYASHATLDDITQAIWWSRQMEKAATEAGDVSLVFTALCGAYDLEVDRGNLEAIERLDKELQRFDDRRFSHASSSLLPAFAMRASWHRDFESALNFLKGTGREESGSGRQALRSAEIAVYAAACGKRELAQAEYDAAADLIRTTEDVFARSPLRTVRTQLFLAVVALMLGRNSSAHNWIVEAEKSTAQLSRRYRTFVKTVRALYVHVETRAAEDDLEAALAALEADGFAGIARTIKALPMPVGVKNTSVAGLTPTEVTILRALVEFGRTKDVAEHLERSPYTINWHIKSIMRKLGCASRREAINIAKSRGII